MPEVRLGHAPSRCQLGSVTRKDHGVAQFAQAPEARQVVAQPAVGMCHHGGAPPEDRIAGENRDSVVGRVGFPAAGVAIPVPVGVVGAGPVVAGEDERQRITGVPRRRQHADLHAGSHDHVTCGQPLVAESVRDVQGADRSVRQGVQRRRSRAVVTVAMGEKDHFNRSRRDDRVEMARLRRAGVDDHGTGGSAGTQNPGVRAVQRHRARVGCEQHRRERSHLPGHDLPRHRRSGHSRSGYRRSRRHRGHHPSAIVSRSSHGRRSSHRRRRAGRRGGPHHREVRSSA